MQNSQVTLCVSETMQFSGTFHYTLGFLPFVGRTNLNVITDLLLNATFHCLVLRHGRKLMPHFSAFLIRCQSLRISLGIMACKGVRQILNHSQIQFTSTPCFRFCVFVKLESGISLLIIGYFAYFVLMCSICLLDKIKLRLCGRKCVQVNSL